MHRCVIYIYIELINLHALYPEHVIRGLEHLSLIWISSIPVLKPAFGMSTAGPGVPGVTLGRGQRVPLPLYVHLLQHI